MTIYKGSNQQVTVAYLPCCYDVEQVSNVKLNFYTTTGSSVEFSGETLNLSGYTATVVFQPAQLELLDDGTLRFIAEFDYSGSPVVKDSCTIYYLKTPAAYEPMHPITEENFSASTAVTEYIQNEVDEMITEALVDYVDEAQLSDTLEDYSTSAQTQSAITEAQPKVYVLNLMSQEERAALVQELIQNYYEEGQNAPSSGFPVEDYQFYYYNQVYQDEGSGFIVLRLSKLTDTQAYFEGILNGYVGRTFKELTVEILSNGDIQAVRQYYVGVFTLDGQNGALTTKTINSNAILGTGNIEVGNIRSTAVNNIWVGTTEQYNAITTKDPQTLYFINDN